MRLNAFLALVIRILQSLLLLEPLRFLNRRLYRENCFGYRPCQNRVHARFSHDAHVGQIYILGWAAENEPRCGEDKLEVFPYNC